MKKNNITYISVKVIDKYYHKHDYLLFLLAYLKLLIQL